MMGRYNSECCYVGVDLDEYHGKESRHRRGDSIGCSSGAHSEGT